MRQDPSGASGGRGLNFFFTSKFQETSATRSLTSGKAFIGATVTGLSSDRSLSRVMHISLGTPVISAEQEPCLPCSSSAALSRWPAPLGFAELRRARPFLRRLPFCILGIRHRFDLLEKP